MEEKHRRRLLEIAVGDVRFDRPMRLYTSLRVGGVAAALVRAGSLEVLRDVCVYAAAHTIPRIVVGKGSNLLVSDRGFPGVVIRLRGALAEVRWEEEGELNAGGGATNRRILDHCSREGIGGLEFLSGIPGTAGGAVATNAGARGRDTGEVLRRVELLTAEGTVDTLPSGELRFSYRSCSLPEGAVVTRAVFHVRREAPEAVTKRIARNLSERRRKQPLRFPSAGSVFRNPPEEPAWRLVERAGLRGKRIGGAQISPLHANFIVNSGGARAEDILSLMNLARDEVLRLTGIELEPEIRTVGFQNKR
ncbi:MAG: UDP-N-acetylmuramate dehydrogenase [Deltaproteobacteria bacterium]|nr:UDP-N-acetylmuramate dehydrogenase [Deltaproteobacteria bacterium]